MVSSTELVTWVGRQAVWRRHARQGSAASSGLGSGLGGTRGRRTTGNLFHWPGGQNRESPRIPHARDAKPAKHGKKVVISSHVSISIMLPGETVTNLEPGLGSLKIRQR